MSKISVNEQYGGDYIRNCIDYFCHLLREPSFYQVLQQNETEFFNSEYGKALTWCQNEEQSPTGTCTRAQIAAFLARSMK